MPGVLAESVASERLQRAFVESSNACLHIESLEDKRRLRVLHHVKQIEVDGLKDELRRYQDDLQQKTDEVQRLTQTSGESDAAQHNTQAKIKLLEKQNTELRQQNKKLNDRVDEVDAELVHARKLLDGANKSSMSELNQKLNENVQERKKQSQHITDLMMELDDIKKTLARVTRTSNEKVQDTGKYESELSELKAQLRQQTQTTGRLEQAMAKQRDEFEQRKAVLERKLKSSSKIEKPLKTKAKSASATNPDISKVEPSIFSPIKSMTPIQRPTPIKAVAQENQAPAVSAFSMTPFLNRQKGTGQNDGDKANEDVASRRTTVPPRSPSAAPQKSSPLKERSVQSTDSPAASAQAPNQMDSDIGSLGDTPVAAPKPVKKKRKLGGGGGGFKAMDAFDEPLNEESFGGTTKRKVGGGSGFKFAKVPSPAKDKSAGAMAVKKGFSIQ